MPPSSSANDFRDILYASQNILAVVGAGISAASGIPTWRDLEGVWKMVDPTVTATPQVFAANPSLVWKHYHEMREKVLRATPNPGHLALSLLCIPDLLATIAPSATFTLVTQNIDGLDARAVQASLEQYRINLAGTSSKISPVYEMHGRVLDTVCTSCHHREHNVASPLCPALGASAAATENDADFQVSVHDLPHCLYCGGLLRPGVVWFEELPLHSREIWKVVDQADLCLVVGTSMHVQPAAAFVHEVADHCGTIAIFNMEHNKHDEERDFLFLGPCAETLPRVIFSVE